MIRYECDLCGVSLPPNSSGRFIIRMEVFAAAGPIDLDAEASPDPRGEMQKILDQLRRSDPDQVEDRTYRAFRFDVCDACRAKVIADPLGRTS